MNNPSMIDALTVTDLVEYQDGSVVSRTVLKTETGSVTAFAFDEGQELSEHSVPHDALAHVVDGEAEIRISGAPHRVRSGQVVLMPANQPHAVVARRRFKMILTMIR